MHSIESLTDLRTIFRNSVSAGDDRRSGRPSLRPPEMARPLKALYKNYDYVLTYSTVIIFSQSFVVHKLIFDKFLTRYHGLR